MNQKQPSGAQILPFSRQVWRILLVSYLIALFFLVVVKFNSLDELLQRRSYYTACPESLCNLIPLHSICIQLHALPQLWALKNLLGNLLAFLPLGFLLPKNFCRCRHPAVTLTLCGGVIVAVEVFQLWSKLGAFDVDDILLNLLSCLFGYLIWRVLLRSSPENAHLRS